MRIATGIAGLLCGLPVLAVLAYAAGSPPQGTPAAPPQAFGIALSPTTMAVTLRNAAIGDSTTGTLGIRNTGNVAADVVLGGSAAGAAALPPRVRIVVYRDRDNDPAAQVYAGTLAAFGAGTQSIGTLGPATGSQRYPSSTTLYLHVSLPTTGSATTDNALQGLSVTETFTATATQHAGP